jgi:hypothetical protein
MIQMSYILVASQRGAVERSVREAMSGGGWSWRLGRRGR